MSVEELQQQIRDLEVECAARAQSQLGYNQEVLTLRAELAIARAACSETLDDLVRVSEQRDRALDRMDQWRAHAAGLQRRMEHAEEENNTLGEQLAALEVENARLRRRTQPVVCPAYEEYSVSMEVS